MTTEGKYSDSMRVPSITALTSAMYHDGLRLVSNQTRVLTELSTHSKLKRVYILFFHVFSIDLRILSFFSAIKKLQINANSNNPQI